MTARIPFLIVGAGAAGCAAAKCFAAAGRAEDVVWLEQHSEPGGSAGYFSRGGPRRTFDAGATQLVECGPGALQEQLYTLAPAQQQAPAAELFEQIPTITQHWPALGRRITLHADGRVTWDSARTAQPEELREIEQLQNFLSVCAQEAHWMWNLLSAIPRFPPQNAADVVRALSLFFRVPWSKKFLFPWLYFATARTLMKRHGLPARGLAHDVVSGLLIDTTQTTPEKSPWLAASMGLSILRRGIFRCRKGMRAYFRPIVSSFEEHKGHYLPNQKVISLRSCEDGFLLETLHLKTNTRSEYLVTDSVLLNLTVWNVVDGLIPANDPLQNTRVYRAWKKRAAREKGWAAFALYALVPDKAEWPETPLYHQIFPHPDEPAALQTSLYVSIPGRSDPAHPPGFRVLTATLHMEASELAPAQREAYTQQLCARIQAALNVELQAVESATAKTFSRYTDRKDGQVGGFRLTLENFLFRAMPSQLTHPTRRTCKLLLMGDTVFPGQGVVACSVSGIIAFERATNLTFRSLRRKFFGAKALG